MPVRQLVYVGLLLLAVAFVQSQEDHSTAQAGMQLKNNVVCGHPRGTDDAKRIAKRSWSRPYGPSKSDRRNWKLIKECARTNYQREVRFPHLWAHYKSLYAQDRKVLRLKLSCDQSPTSSVVHCIEYASVVHSYPEATLIQIAECESHLDPYAGNPSGASGLFQFMPSTWSSTLARMGEKYHSVFSAKWSSLAAAWKMAHDGTGEWSCA